MARECCDSVAERTIGGHVKCSVRSIFSCCFALAILSTVFSLLLYCQQCQLAVATRLSRVYCSRDATGRPLHAHALMHLAYHSYLGSARAWVVDREQGNETLLQIYA
jgi:hypothetical protein